jgi:uncharacterized membrane protein YfbV (UPF0208 family)
MASSSLIFVPIVMGIAQVIKMTGFNKKFIPLIDLVLGIIFGIFFVSPEDIRQGILQGIYIGLAASGAYSGAKNVIQGLKNSN